MTVLRLRQDEVFWTESGNEVIALDTVASHYLSANRTAAAVWKRLSEGATEPELVDALCERFSVERDVAETDVRSLVQELTERGLLEP